MKILKYLIFNSRIWCKEQLLFVNTMVNNNDSKMTGKFCLLMYSQVRSFGLQTSFRFDSIAEF